MENVLVKNGRRLGKNEGAEGMEKDLVKNERY